MKGRSLPDRTPAQISLVEFHVYHLEKLCQTSAVCVTSVLSLSEDDRVPLSHLGIEMWAKTTFWTPFKTDDATGSREEEDIERIKSSCSQASKRVNELRIRTSRVHIRSLCQESYQTGACQ